MPGVSSKAWRNKKKKAAQRTDWDNAGVGLFFAHQLFRKLEQFYIASCGSSIYLNHEKLEVLPCSIEGTLISMRMSLPDESQIISAIKEIKNLAIEVKAKLVVRGLEFKSVQAFLNSGT